MTITKKAKLEQFDTIHKERGLLERYFWDSREKLIPDAKATYRTKDGDKFVAFRYGMHRADGGYVIVECNPGVPSIQWADEWETKVRELPFTGEWSLAMRSLAEQLRHATYVAA